MTHSLTKQVLQGDRYALSRALSEIDKDTELGDLILSELHPNTGNAWVIGLTGPPGCGKSTLVNRLALILEARGQKVAIIAIDPSSPYSGGAILGDRIRMRDLYGKPNVFIRSLSSRGHLGGISSSTHRMRKIFDAAGYSTIFIETVGIGQNEVEVANLAHTTIVVEAPGFGDEIQAIKAGILEIADIMVVNKSDLPGAERTALALRNVVELGHSTKATSSADWVPPITHTSSENKQGDEELLAEIERHKEYMKRSGQKQIIDQRADSQEIEQELTEWVLKNIARPENNPKARGLLEQIYAKTLTPRQAARKLIEELFKK